MLIDSLGDMLANVIIGVVTTIGVDALNDANVMIVLEFTLTPASEDSLLSWCLPCCFWLATAWDSARALHAWMPSYHV